MAQRLGRWRDAAAIYGDRRIVAIFFMGFSSGLPLALTGATLGVWLAESQVSLITIGLFALVGLAYNLKFLWAPVMDRAPVPWLTRWLGRRRSWALVTQFALIAALLGLGNTEPSADIELTALFAVIVAFFSASQDIVIDAFRIDLLEDHEQGAGAASTQFGYRLGLLGAGAGALYAASYGGWSLAYGVMAACVCVGVAAVLLTPEPRREVEAGLAKGVAIAGMTFAEWLKGAVVEPFVDFARRHRAWMVVLVFVLLYKFGDAFAGVMASPFYVDVGFTKIEIANVSKVFGVAATILGVFLGGTVVYRLGIMKALLVCGVLQMLSNLMFAVQAAVGHSVPLLVVTIGVENVTGGMGSAAFVAYLSSLCNVAFSATQYALLSSFMAMGRTVLSSSGGWFADQLGWVSFFLLSTAVALPGLLLLLWLMSRVAPAPRPAAGESAAG
jgi:PAT family beta-lactamase induction signal transducer AmpG